MHQHSTTNSAAQPPHEPRLWFSAADVSRLRERVNGGEPTALAICQKARAMADLKPGASSPGPESGHDRVTYIAACSIAYLLDGEPRHAQQAFDAMIELVLPWSDGELARGTQSLIGAVAHECCYAGWSASQQVTMTNLLFRLTDSFRHILPQAGDPHDVTNNHWAVAHAGAAIAAMAAHGHAKNEAGELYDLRDQIEWARGRTRAFLMHHGDAGLYHEGLGYLGYPATFWLPLVVASPRFDGVDMLEDFPNLRRLAASLFSTVAARPTRHDDDANTAKAWGMKLSWNDDGVGWMQSCALVLAMHIAEPAQQGALRWMYDRLNGLLSPTQAFNPEWGGWFFTLFFYPYDTPAADPAGVLPNHVLDTRQGIIVLRNRYQDGDDAIFGAYARVTHVGGHSHDDAASIRMMALGHDWIMGGGQARGEAVFQSVVTPADGSRRKPNWYGAIVWDEARPDGGIIGIDHRRCCGCYAERYISVDYSAASGSPVVLAMLDLIDDHLGREWHWNMTYERGLQFSLHPDELGFSLSADDGANLNVRFLGAPPMWIEQRAMPDSSRRYQSGITKNYPGRPYVCANFGVQPTLGIYAVMAVQRAGVTPIQQLQGLDVQVGSHAWLRPFGACVPPDFDPAACATLCRWPTGKTLE